MKRFWVQCCLSFGILTGVDCARGAAEADWRIGTGALLTRWAAEVNPTNAHPEYPRPQMVRARWLNLNGLWDYAVTFGTDAAPDHYDGKILVPFPIEAALSGVMRRLAETNKLWYQRQVSIPKEWRGQRIRMHFGAVDWQAQVWVNGKLVGRHRGGYDSFTFDITEQLGWQGPEQITVQVTDMTEEDQPRGKQSLKQEGIFYTPSSGIWRTVWLEPVGEISIDRIRITPEPAAKAVRLWVAANSLADNLRAEVIVSEGGQERARQSGAPNAELVVTLPEVHEWSPEDPHLYDLKVVLRAGGQVVDSVDSYFGMRKIELLRDDQGVMRIALNGKFTFQVGTLDQGFWPDGIYTAPTDAALRSDVEYLKRSGFNLIRKHVKVEPDRWYYWCDRLGMLVWQDMPSGNNATVSGRRNFEAELLRMVRGLGNHPSVVAWVLFNEGWGQYDTERLTQWVKTLDPTRLVNNASGWTDMRVGDLVDMHSYPGPDCPTPESRRAAVLGEFGGLGLTLTNHLWSARSWGYLMLPDQEALGARYTRAFKQVWALHHFRGLSAAIYTQTSDVETECNGLLTYDRAVAKIDPEVLLAANRGDFPGPPMKIVLADAMVGRTKWNYTVQNPGEDWFKPDFDASGWPEGVGGFGSEGTPGSYTNTSWKTPDIWLRREFGLTEEDLVGLRLRVYHDEDLTVYLNGVRALELKGYAVDYEEYEISSEAAAALRVGTNLIAVHCHQTSGGQGVDVGILARQAAPQPASK